MDDFKDQILQTMNHYFLFPNLALDYQIHLNNSRIVVRLFLVHQVAILICPSDKKVSMILHNCYLNLHFLSTTQNLLDRLLIKLKIETLDMICLNILLKYKFTFGIEYQVSLV